jgi:hypothetical protein
LSSPLCSVAGFSYEEGYQGTLAMRNAEVIPDEVSASKTWWLLASGSTTENHALRLTSLRGAALRC